MIEDAEGKKTNRPADEQRDDTKHEWERTFDAVPDLIAIIDLEHRIVRANRAMAERLGMSPEQCAGLPCYQCFHALGASPSFCPHDQTLADAREHKVEVYEEHLGGYFLITCTPLLDSHGGILGTVHVARDITQRKRMEEDLKRSESILAQAGQMAHLGAWELELSNHTDLDRNRLRWSDEVYRIFGYEPGSVAVTNDLFFQHVHPEDRPRIADTVAHALAHRQPYEIEHRIVRTDGAERIVLEHADIRFDSQGRPQQMIGAVQDITFRKQMEAELRRWNEQLKREVQAQTEELRASVDQLNQEVAHRIMVEAERQKAFTELQERARQLQQLTLELSQAEDRERKRLAEVLHDDLQQLLAAAKFHLGLLIGRIKGEGDAQEWAATVTDLLKQAIAKSRSLSHELSPPTLSHSDLYETLEWLTQQVQAKHGLTVHLEAFDRLTIPSESLKAFLYKAAQEMLFNVVKHAGVKDARLRLRRRNGRIYLSVADEGRGFAPQAPGTAGFGLWSIRERVELLGGRMRIRSTEGKGSTIVLTVPDAEPPQTKTEGSKERTDNVRTVLPSKVHSGPTLRVLLVDDHKIVRQGIRAMLAEAPDIEVVGEAGNGQEAIDLTDQLVPDVVVMDMAMPIMAGDEATRQIKRRLPDTKVVALSMFDDTQVANRMRQAGAAAYLLKTAPAEELLTAIRG